MLRSSFVPRKGTSRQPELLLDLRRGEGSLHAQIEHALREAARTGRLAAGTPLPSSRTLARDLGVSRRVVVEAYEQLAAEGYVETRPGSRTAIADGLRPPPPRLPQPTGERLRFDFRPGQPDLTHFPREEWGRAARRVVRSLGPGQLGYGDPLGTTELRSALANYLGRVRGARCDPQRIVVCTGVTQALFLVARALSRLGLRRIAVEDPSNPDLRRILRAGGLAPCGVPVDSSGLDVEALERADVRAVVVSPAHQYPTGSVLTADRRRALLAWAERRSGFVVEDDYDAEYRYDRAPVGALQGLAPDRVAYTGSASKTLAPALRLGWLLAPPALLEPLTEAKRCNDLGTPAIEQLVYANFLRDGSLDRHLRRMRSLYRSRRDALLAALERWFPEWVPHGVAAGLHVMVTLPRTAEEEAVVAAAARRSVRLYPVREFTIESTTHLPAIVIGYACLTESEISAGIASLAG